MGVSVYDTCFRSVLKGNNDDNITRCCKVLAHFVKTCAIANALMSVRSSECYDEQFKGGQNQI